ncbi:hypothetical protein EON65_43080, partial [archaeon]
MVWWKGGKVSSSTSTCSTTFYILHAPTMPQGDSSSYNTRFGRLWRLSALGIAVLTLGLVSVYVILHSHHRLDLHFSTIAPSIDNLVSTASQSTQKPTISKLEVNQTSVLKVSFSDPSVPNTPLPAFTSDHTDYVLSALIERSSHSTQLFVTSFMLCHNTVVPPVRVFKHTFESINASAMSHWQRAVKRMNSTQYTKPMGIRVSNPGYWCRIHTVARIDGATASSSIMFEVQGRMLPSSMSNDFNANHRLDILRCPLPSNLVYNVNVHAGMYLRVDIVRSKVNTVLSFVIPWQTRIASYVNLHPLVTDYFPVSDALKASQTALMRLVQSSKRIDPWQHNLPSISPSSPKTIFLCTTAWQKAIDKDTLSHLLEFIEHHVAVGVDHIYLGVAFPWQSEDMWNA